MRQALFLILTVALLALLVMALPACDKSDDGDDDDDDTRGDPYPESMELCWGAYHEYEPWFEIDGYSSSLGEVFPDFGDEDLHFQPATVLLSGNLVKLIGGNWWLSIAWATDAVVQPFADGQAVQVSIRPEDYVDGVGPYIRHIWVLDETGQTLFFFLPAIFSVFEEVDNRFFMFDVPLLCQLAKKDEPPLDGYEWDFVYQKGLTAIIGDVGVRMTTLNTGLDYSVDGGYAFTVTKNYFGRIKDFEATCVGDTVTVGDFQMVRLAP